MSEIEKKAIEDLKKFRRTLSVIEGREDSDLQLVIAIILNLIEKQDKMIDLMAQTLLNYGFVLIKSKKGLKEYFRKKVENEN